MNFTIKNKDYCAKIEETGAELSSLFYIPTGTEYLWQKEKGIWENSAPILFPIVGRLKGGGYYYNGKRYDMDIHGFAKDSKFEILLKNQDNLVLHLEDNGLTHKQYPFSFSLDVSFSLLSNGIKVSYRVQNLGNETMYFSIGSHPGFKLPLENCSLENYYIQFEKKERLCRYKIEQGLLNKKGEFLKDSNRITLSKKLFEGDALIFKEISSHNIWLKNDKIDYSIKMNTGKAPSLGIWSKPNAPYVCIEPWWGYDEDLSATGDIKEKKGIISLLPSKTFNTNYSIQIGK